MKAISILLVAALALTLEAAFADAQAVNASGHCTGMTVTDFVSSDSNDSTESTHFVNIIDGHLNFTTSSTGCVIITFSGAAFDVPETTNIHEALHVRTLLDGTSLCAPAAINDIFSDAELPEPETANSITRICKNVVAGAHTVQVQFRGSGFGSDHINGHVLTVTHN